MKLWAHQERALVDLRQAYAQGRKSPCLVMPTGSGKSRVAAEIAKSATAKGKRVVFMAAQLELLDQEARTMRACGIDNVRTIQAGKDIGAGEVVVASIPTLNADRFADQLPPADLVIWDECHGIKARTHLALRNKYSTAFHLGLTATPARGDGAGLGDVFDAIVVGATVAELTEKSLLVPARVFAPPTILDPRTLALEPVDAYLKHCQGRRTIVFCTTIEHAEKVSAGFRARGLKSKHVTGDMSERSDVIAEYAAGSLDVLVNVNLLIQGWDDPPTSAAIFARRFTYQGPFLQACGRTLRTAVGKQDAVIVDLCGSALVHGTPDADRTYSLDGKAIRTADREALRQCPACGGVFATRDVCPYCACVLPKAVRSLPTANGEGVSEIAPKAKPTSWPMRAKKRSLCAGCGQVIDQGAWIIYSASRRTAMHTPCAAQAHARRAA